MKSLNDLLLLGDPLLYQKSDQVLRSELPLVKSWIQDLDNVLNEVKNKYGFGRGIAAPQLGIMKRLFYIKIDKPLVFINPEIMFLSDDKFELWDDCMSFPNLLVKIRRHQQIKMNYKDENWTDCEFVAEGAMSELIQHEYDHLNGILCISHAIDEKSFKWRK
jgi:peptide deformylase